MPASRRATTTAPRIEPLQHRGLEQGDPAELTGDADLDGRAFLDVHTDVLGMRAATLHDCQLAGVTATEADWMHARLHETSLDRVNVPVVRAARGIWRDVHVTGSRLGSIEAYETSWQSVHFVGCKLSFLNLRGAELLDVAFTDCIIEELDLVQTTARRVSFTGTRVSRLNLQHGALEHVDLRGGDFEEINGLDGLRGATISPMQLTLLAPLLAQEKGIKVEEA